MKKVFIILISFLFISCFTEPNKTEEKVQNIEKIILYEKEEVSLRVLNKLLRFQIKDFEDWCKTQNFIYNTDYDSGVFDFGYDYISYSNADKSKLISLKIPTDNKSNPRVSYHTSIESEYKNILKDIENSDYKLESKTEDEIKYNNHNNILTLNINNASEEAIYSISLKTNKHLAN